MTPEREIQTDPLPDLRELGVRQAEFDRRLAQLRRLARRTPEEQATATTERALELLRQGLRDLAADSLDLHRQINELGRRLERRPVVSGGNRRLAMVARGAARRGLGFLRAVRRRLRSGVGETLEAAVARDPSLDPVWSRPLVAIVVRDRNAAGVEPQLEMSLREQTLVRSGDVEWVRMGATEVRIEGNDVPSRCLVEPRPEELRAALAAPFVFTAHSQSAGLWAASLELAALELLLEDLLFVVLPTGESSFDSSGQSRGCVSQSESAAEASPAGGGDSLVARREIWSPEGGVDWEAVASVARREGRWVVGKVIRQSAAGPLRRWRTRGGAPSASGAETESGQWRDDGYFTLSGVPVAPLRTAPASCRLEPRPAADERPSTLIVLPALEDTDAAELLVGLMRRLGERTRFAAVSLGPQVRRGREVLEAMLRTTPWVFPLVDQPPPELLRARLAYLVSRVQGESLVWVAGGSGEGDTEVRDVLAQIAESRPQLRLSCLTMRAAAVGAYEGWGLFENVSLLGGDVPAGVDPALYDPRRFASAERSRRRRELGVEGELLVVMAGPLLPEHRPEDFLAVAHRLRHDRRFAFVLAGDGPLATNVDELQRFLELTNLRRIASFPDRAELLAAADVAMSPAEHEPAPLTMLGALAMERPVVVSGRSGVASVIGDTGCGRVVSATGDVAALAEALESLTDAGERRALGERGRRTALERFSLEASVEAFARLTAAPLPTKAAR